MLKKIVYGLWFTVIGLLFLYSFVQVDLGLTLTRASIFLTIEKSFQYVGWFNRPLSALLYCSLALLLLTLYLWTLFLVRRKKINGRVVWVITIVAGVVLAFTYNAFSYDLFNYIFDARIFSHYHLNPYQYKALDFPSDPMLGFMHWTHRTYPYGPSWLVLTVPLSYLGLGYFLPTFYLFKFLMLGAYFLSCFLIFKIAKKTKIVDPVFALSFFALNPFILIEGLVSAHNDIVMMAIALLGVYFLVEGKKFTSFLFLFLSIGIKFATVLLLPLFLWYPFSKRKNKDFLFFLGTIFLMLIGVYLASARTLFQPWYFLLVIPFAAFLSNKYYVFIPSILFSFLILFQYVPYLYTGNYNPPIPMVMDQMLWWSMGASIVTTLIYGVFKRTR